MTNRQLLELMDEPERSQAIENTEKYNPEFLDREGLSTHDAIESGFFWDETPEGQGLKYWKSICDKYI